MEKIIIVDKNDNFLYVTPRDKKEENEIYRVTALWIENSQGEVLISQRALTKKTYPGLYGTAVTGTVSEGESYEDNVVKEAEEEIGLTGVKCVFQKKIFVNDNHPHFVSWYKVIVDKDISYFNINHEVESVCWMSKKDLRIDVDKNPKKYMAHMLNYCHELFDF